MARVFLGSFEIKKGDVLNVTDPCYKNKVWCNYKITDIKPGKYNVYYNTTRDGRISKLRIVHNNYSYKLTNDIIISYDIGVDAGLCGFFINKPDYTDEEWGAICDYLSPLDYPTKLLVTKESPFKCDGAVVTSGYGDGVYELRGYLNNERLLCSLEIIFI